MSVKPILFSEPMVRAILEGRKTQTRRVLKPQLGDISSAFEFTPGCWRFLDKRGNRCHQVLRIPYSSGDLLWVREAWRCLDGLDLLSGSQIAERCTDAGYQRPWAPIRYEADGECTNWIREPLGFGTEAGRYRPGMFMPRWASRLTLRVTDVRVQRLQEIGDDDAVAEGVPQSGGRYEDEHSGRWHSCTVAEFRALWDSLNAKRGLGWEQNPWIFAISFDVKKGNIDAL